MIDSLLNIMKEEHLFFAHLFLGGFGIILSGLCFFEGKHNTIKWVFAPVAILISLLCYSISIIPFFHAKHIQYFFLIKILLLILISLVLFLTYFISSKQKKKPFHMILLFIGIIFLYYSVICEKPGYFDTFYPISFVLILLTIFAAKYHVWSYVKLLEFYCAFLILFFPTLILFTFIAVFYGFNIEDASFISMSVFLFLFPLIVFANLAKNILYRKLFYRINMEKNIYKNLIDETSMNPFASQKSLLSSFFKNMKNVGEFELLSILLLDDDKSAFLMRDNLEEWQKKILLEDDILTQLSNFCNPFSKSMFVLSNDNEKVLDFLKSITVWNLLDYVIPVRTENQLKLLLFINQSNKSETYTKYVHFLLFLQRMFEFIIFSSEKLKTDVSMKDLFNQTAEKQFSYEIMLKKVEHVNEAYNKLQEKQQQLIESERWISLSQISVTLNHEINNPLTLILGLAQFIQVKIKKGTIISSEEFKDDLTLIFEQCQRIVEIIKSLRKISVPVIEKYLPNIEMIKLDLNSDWRK